MAKVKINPGICGFITTGEITSEDGVMVNIKIKTGCEQIKNIGKEIENINGFDECFLPYGEGVIAKATNKHCKHPACPIPIGILKGVEVACNMALPKESKIEVEK